MKKQSNQKTWIGLIDKSIGLIDKSIHISDDIDVDDIDDVVDDLICHLSKS
jgi:hypothetical protein